MKFQLLTLVSIATTTLAINLEQVRLINDDELMVQDAQFDYPAIVNLKDQDAEIAKKTITSSSSTTTTTTAKKDKKTTSTTSASSTTTTSTKSNSTSSIFIFI